MHPPAYLLAVLLFAATFPSSAQDRFADDWHHFYDAGYLPSPLHGTASAAPAHLSGTNPALVARSDRSAFGVVFRYSPGLVAQGGHHFGRANSLIPAAVGGVWRFSEGWRLALGYAEVYSSYFEVGGFLPHLDANWSLSEEQSLYQGGASAGYRWALGQKHALTVAGRLGAAHLRGAEHHDDVYGPHRLWGIHWALGILYAWQRPHGTLVVHAYYQPGISLKGTMQYEGTGLNRFVKLREQSGEGERVSLVGAEVTHRSEWPAQFGAGVAVPVAPWLTMQAALQRTHWAEMLFWDSNQWVASGSTVFSLTPRLQTTLSYAYTRYDYRNRVDIYFAPLPLATQAAATHFLTLGVGYQWHRLRLDLTATDSYFSEADRHQRLALQGGLTVQL